MTALHSTLTRLALAAALLLPLSPAQAQSVQFNLGGSGGLGGAAGFGIHVGATLRNVTVVEGYSLDGRLSLVVGGTSSINLDSLLVLATSGVDVYGGPGLSVGGFGLRPTLTVGLSTPLSGLTGLYGEGFYRLDSGFGVRAGLTFIY